MHIGRTSGWDFWANTFGLVLTAPVWVRLQLAPNPVRVATILGCARTVVEARHVLTWCIVRFTDSQCHGVRVPLSTGLLYGFASIFEG